MLEKELKQPNKAMSGRLYRLVRDGEVIKRVKAAKRKPTEYRWAGDSY
jgi:hypothetical protein